MGLISKPSVASTPPQASFDASTTIYGDVSAPVIFVTYSGIDSNSATVSIDNTNRTIAVKVKPTADNSINNVEVDGESVVVDRVASIILAPKIAASVALETDRATAAEADAASNIQLLRQTVEASRLVTRSNELALSQSIQGVSTRVEQLETIINEQLEELDMNVNKLYYCNIFLMDCAITQINDLNTDMIERGTPITKIKISVGYNKLPKGARLYIIDRIFEAVDENNNPLTEISLTNITYPFTTALDLKLLSTYDGSVSTKQLVAKVVNGIYCGVATMQPSGSITEQWIKQTFAASYELSDGFLTGKPLELQASDYLYYICPKSYGIPLFTLSPAQFIGGVDFVKSLSITNTSGYTEEYDVWRSDNSGLGNITVKVERQ